MKRILIVNGPNLNMLGKREPEIYGTTGWADCFTGLCARFPDMEIRHFQSNSEGAIIDRLQLATTDGTEGIIINPGAYTHYSLAIADALAAINIPAIEVHISNIYAREPERSKSITAPRCVGLIAGLGLDGYRLAVEALLNM